MYNLRAYLYMHRMQSKKAGLEEMFRVYVLSRSLPAILSILNEIVDNSKTPDNSENWDETAAANKSESLQSKFIQPLEKSMDKFGMYQQFIQHVLDLEALPDLEINPVHDPTLQELRAEKEDIEFQAQSLLQEAQKGWGREFTMTLDTDPRNRSHGIVFRSTRTDDERALRNAKKDLKILSILKNGVHFTTSALESLSYRYREVQEEYAEKQQTIMQCALETALTYLPLVESVCDELAELDVLVGFATAASYAPMEYTRPVMRPQGSGIVSLKGARHPCVEFMDDVQFVPNDYELVKGRSAMQIITGPNMGGKSTYIRGLGSIVVMAHIGSFVPCSQAEISIVTAVLARVGAGDSVQKGVSTFMAEMLEASVILGTASADSLIIIDELGRGTSTFDGFGLAWGISEHIANKIGAYCLFATHFHELTALAQASHVSADESSEERVESNVTLTKANVGVVNRHVTGKVINGKVVMLYAVENGPCHESFGVHVAAMAQFPDKVIQTAKRKAIALEHTNMTAVTDVSVTDTQGKIVKVMDRFGELPMMTIPACDMKIALNSCFAD